MDPSAARRLTAVARRSLGIWTLIRTRGRVADVEAKARVRMSVRVLVLVHGTIPSANAKVKNKDELPAHRHCHCHCHHRHRRRCCQCYQPHCWRGASYGLKMGPAGPRRQQGDLGMASPFLPLLGRWSGMGEAWRGRAPSSVGADACACVGQIELRVP